MQAFVLLVLVVNLVIFSFEIVFFAEETSRLVLGGLSGSKLARGNEVKLILLAMQGFAVLGTIQDLLARFG